MYFTNSKMIAFSKLSSLELKLKELYHKPNLNIESLFPPTQFLMISRLLK